MAKIPPFDVAANMKPEEFQRAVSKAFFDLQQILLSLSPAENFRRFIWTGTIPVSSELGIRHPLKRIPTGYLIVRSRGGTIQDGPTAWTAEKVYLEEYSGLGAVTATVIFFL